MSENSTNPPPFERSQRRNRKRMAWCSFGLIAGVSLYLLWFGLQSDTNAARVNALSFVYGTALGVWISIVLAYFGAATFVDVGENK